MSKGCLDCQRRAVGLTARDVQILEHVAQGYANKEIAQRLRLAEPTIKNRITRTNAALGTQDRTQAVLVAHALGLLDLPKLARQCAKRLGHKAGR